ncbi:MAG TPA: dTDP-4-dehydrorhamnose reductase [Jatrophihabitans sp.]|uniref:dTDP-4-dehydrorhamnose reductase n=1 Tax=Jatrophihabitans sp. TaxID=1932789 RepID=UPI002E055A31|nr:dTDP-4-dehydrorhamnose reductase [Jatrophihabitans sp.]
MSDGRRWLVTGANGQLGGFLADRLRLDNRDFAALTRDELDITSAASIDAALRDVRPSVVINAAAYTAVDRAEVDEDRARLVNATGPQLLAEALAERGGRLIHVSTDYVFDGTADHPYKIDDPTGPQSAYGRTKLAGEQAVRAALPERSHVVRTAWVYGGPGANFVNTMRRLEGERETVQVVADQIGSPTFAADLAAGLVELAGADVPGGLLHYVNAGQASWFELTREIFRLIGADPARVQPVDSAAFPRPAKRPAWSVLSTRSWTAAGLGAPQPWPDALARAIALDPPG